MSHLNKKEKLIMKYKHSMLLIKKLDARKLFINIKWVEDVSYLVYHLHSLQKLNVRWKRYTTRIRVRKGGATKMNKLHN